MRKSILFLTALASLRACRDVRRRLTSPAVIAAQDILNELQAEIGRQLEEVGGCELLRGYLEAEILQRKEPL
jgi:hypothetical protein